MHPICLCAEAHISAKLGRNRDIKVSMESGEHTGPLWAYNLTRAQKLACMHAMCLCAWAHISAKLGQIREIKIYMEPGEHAGPLWTHNLTRARKLACIHPMCLHAKAYISAKLGWIREIKLYMESGEQAHLSDKFGWIRRSGKHTIPVWLHNKTKARKLACMHALCLHAQAHISAKMNQTRNIEVSMESGDHAGSV